MNNQVDGDILTREEACQLLRVSRSTLWKLTKNGEVPAYRIGRGRTSGLRYKKEELLQWLESQRV